ncbi:hypothetical protein [Paenibacillus harenae]|uniref:hypothetical protein n=1 Tax=Paenibacillus harenae TaxID=306543 RepID=UPI00040C3C73|nr:hypothetical protein [Paenibacillus harenae]
MLKNRFFLIGLGSGIMIGALLFQLMLLGEQSKDNLKQIGATDEHLYTQSEVDALLKAERDSALLNEKKDSEPAAEEKEASSEDKPAADEALHTNSEKPDIAAKERLIRIEAGTTLSQTAELLFSNHIIGNQAKFVKIMKEDDKRVRAGFFLFPEGISVAEAVTIVTKKPLTLEQAEAIAEKTKTE